MSAQALGWNDWFNLRMSDTCDSTGCSGAEFLEAYPERMLRQEWEAYLDRCAEREVPFSRQLLQSLPIALQYDINRRSKGGSLPAGYVIPKKEVAQ